MYIVIAAQGKPLVPQAVEEDGSNSHFVVKLGNPANTEAAYLEVINQVSILHLVSQRPPACLFVSRALLKVM